MISRWDDPNAVLGAFTDQAYSLTLLAEFEAVFRRKEIAFAGALEFLRSKLMPVVAAEDIEEGVKAFFEDREPVPQGR